MRVFILIHELAYFLFSRPLLMKWDITWECVTILEERILEERIVMVTWTTRTAQITGPNAVWRTSPKQRKAALELAVVVAVVELELRTRNRQLVAQMFRAMQSIASNSNGPVPIHGILGSEKTARKLAKHARSF